VNVSCPQCRTVFRVNPAKVPKEGVRARCAVCGGTFEVAPPASAEMARAPRAGPSDAAAPPSEAPASAAARTPSAPSPAPAPRESAPAGAPTGPRGGAAPPPPPPPPPGPAAAPTAAAEAGATRPGAPATDIHARARRLARALVSDLVTYHPDLQERGLREGRLKELFREEIKRSWQEYVEQVGLEVAKSTPYFRDALNEILARGERVF
jgi:predicted Zn finger-like uncharacterized protein